jgi:hypothetical protein
MTGFKTQKRAQVKACQNERENSMSKGKTDQKSGTVKSPVIVFITYLVCAVIGGGLFLAFRLGQGSSDDEPVTEKIPGIEREIVTTVPGRGMVVNEENASSIKEWAETPVQDASYRVRMNMEWNFPDCKTASDNAYVENAETNKRTVYFDVALADTNEIVYSSPFIPVTARLEGFKLDTDLAAGTYPAVVTYHLVDDDFQEITTVAMNITINVEK